MDEIPLFVNIHIKKTIAKIGAKEVNIETHNKKIHYTVILWIVADDTRLPPMLLFKIHQEEKMKNNLKASYDQRTKDIFILSTKDLKKWLIMKLWISEVWRKYIHFEIWKDIMFVIDDSSIHMIENIQQKIKDYSSKIRMISGRLTR